MIDDEHEPYDQCYKCEHLEKLISSRINKKDLKRCHTHMMEREAMSLGGFKHLISPCANFELSQRYRMSDKRITESIENKSW